MTGRKKASALIPKHFPDFMKSLAFPVAIVVFLSIQIAARARTADGKKKLVLIAGKPSPSPTHA